MLINTSEKVIQLSRYSEFHPNIGSDRYFQEDFLTDASSIALSANQISSMRASANHKATSKYQLKCTFQTLVQIENMDLIFSHEINNFHTEI